jgi:hypothetical protein
MLRTVEGVCREGKIELDEIPSDVDGARVLVTFLFQPVPPLRDEPQIDKELTAEARWRFGAIADDWDRPEMDVYDEL